jgi:hypothetical protein
MRIFSLFGALGLVAGEKLKYENSKPNIVFAIIDDYGYNDIGYHQVKSIRFSFAHFRILSKRRTSTPFPPRACAWRTTTSSQFALLPARSFFPAVIKSTLVSSTS